MESQKTENTENTENTKLKLDALNAKELQPRERLAKFGARNLSDLELIAILLNTGIKGKNVKMLARELLKIIRSKKEVPPINEMSKITGLGPAKSSLIIAMMEFGRRYWGNRGMIIHGAHDVFKLLRHHADSKQEMVFCVSLNGAHEIIESRVITVGLVNKAIIHPREIFADVITDRACAICIAHNHPSGNCMPSSDDDEMTIKIEKAAELLGITFLDHIIFTTNDFFSYKKSKKFNFS